MASRTLSTLILPLLGLLCMLFMTTVAMNSTRTAEFNNSAGRNAHIFNNSTKLVNSTAQSNAGINEITRLVNSTAQVTTGINEINDDFSMAQFEGLVPVCSPENAPNHGVFCSGPILEAVTRHRLFPDSKTFVDKPLKFPPDQVLQSFHAMFPDPELVRRDQLQRFVADNFFEEGTEMQSCKLEDWNERPLRLAAIGDPALRAWALDLNRVWRSLCREVDPVVGAEADRFSLLYVPHRFIVPGGRFREFYYWDSYWTIKGLLASGMHETAKSMLSNFVYIVQKYGFVPNGGRVYYLTRSQPPLLSGMIYEYYEATHDLDFLAQSVGMLEKELHFWDTNRRVKLNLNGTEFEVYQYRAASNSPRPESFREDVELVKRFRKPQEKQQVWRDLASAAESGWDFSSRWLRDYDRLSSIETTQIAPVDLNAFICWNMNILSYFFDELNQPDKAEEYRNRLGRFRALFQRVFYVRNESGWFDFNLRTGRHNLHFHPSIVTPLFTRCYHSLNHRQDERIFDTMEERGAFRFMGGVPASLQEGTRQQWDFPNGWSPLNHIIIEGLRQSESPRMQYKAFLLAQKWVLSNYRVYRKTGAMWEKYDVIGSSPNKGSGGEYAVQAGFGWTNGVILDLLVTYGEQFNFPLLAEENSEPGEVKDQDADLINDLGHAHSRHPKALRVQNPPLAESSPTALPTIVPVPAQASSIDSQRLPLLLFALFLYALF